MRVFRQVCSALVLLLLPLGIIHVFALNSDSYKPFKWDWQSQTKDFNYLPRVLCPNALYQCVCKSDSKKSTYMVDCGGVLKDTSGIYRIPRNTTHLGLYQNEFQTIPNGSFHNMTSLVYLDLSDNYLKNVESEAFDDLHNLTFLDLSDNSLCTQAAFLRPLTSLRVLNLVNQFYEIKYFANEISELKGLDKLRIFGNYLSKDDIFILQNTSVTYLSIIFYVYKIEQAVFSSWNALNAVELTGNEYFNVPAADVLKNLSGLHVERLYIESGINGEANFKEFKAPNLRALSIYNTDVEEIVFQTEWVLPPLHWLDVSYNRVDYIYVSELEQLYYLNISQQTSKKCYNVPSLPESLISLDLSGTQGFLSTIQSCFFLIEFVNLSHTGLQASFDFESACGTVYKVDTRHLDLEDNELQCINSRVFTQHDWSALNVLKLSNNLLGFGDSVDCNDMKDTHFLDFLKPLWNLTELYLDKNSMKYDLPPHVLVNQTKLQSLHLSDMLLSNLTLGMSHMIDLKFLDLSLNKIQCFYTSAMRDINTIIHYTPLRRNASRTMEINLSDNTLRCSCSCLEFYQWIRNVHPYITFTYMESYQCIFDNGWNISLSNLNVIINILHSQCISKDWSLLIRTSTVMLFLYSFILTATMLFRFRHTLRYIWLKHKRHRQYLERHILDPKYHYDAFVSCERTDAIWVKRKVLPELENQHKGLKFCVAQRNFIVGATIIDNIVRSINQSRKVVYVISQNFLKSGWCKEELLIGHQESLSRGKNIIICIFMPDIVHNQLSDRLRFILNHVTCIKWPRDPAAQQVFWIMLQRAILDGEVSTTEV